MKKKVLSLILAIALVCGMVPCANASATICGMEEHAHTDACYSMVQTCGQEASEEHVHSDSCFTRTLTCGKAEHTHTDACYPAPTEPPQPTPTAAPQPTDAPQVTEAPHVTDAPQATDAPQITDPPQVTEAPQITDPPQATNAPLPTAAETPSPTETPQITASPSPSPTPTPSPTPQPTSAPLATATPEPTPLPGEDDDAVEQSDAEVGDYSLLKIQMQVSPSVVLVGQKAVWRFTIQSSAKTDLNWYLYKDGVQIKSGTFTKDERSYSYTPKEAGTYAFKLVAKLQSVDPKTGKTLTAMKIAKTVKVKAVTSLEEEAAATQPEEPADKPEEEDDDDFDAASPLNLKLSVEQKTVLVGRQAAWQYAVLSDKKAETTWQLFKDDREIKTGRFITSSGIYSFIPNEPGVYALRLTAKIQVPSSENKDELVTLEKTKVVKLKVIEPPELAVVIKAHAASCFGGESVSFGITRSDNEYAKAAEATITVWQNGAVIYESTEFEETVRVKPAVLDFACTVRIKVTLKDQFGQTAEATVAIPCAMHEDETRYLWSQMLKDVKMTGNWPEDLLTIAKTQLGYRESMKDFIILEDGERQGWTRYGAWYGLPYEEWCSMFVSFCLEYAGVPQWGVPQSASQQRLRNRLIQKGLYATREDAEPLPGDLIFFDHETKPWESGYGVSDHIGIVLDVDDEWVYTIEGNSNLRVRERQYLLTDEHIIGYGLVTKAYEANLAGGLTADDETESDDEPSSEREDEADAPAIPVAEPPKAAASEEKDGGDNGEPDDDGRDETARKSRQITLTVSER